MIALIALLVAAPWYAPLERLWKKPDPQVSAALEKLRTGDAPKAVEILDKAGESLKEPTQQGALAYDKGAALLMVGPQGASIAADESKKAMEGAATELHEPAAYNLGFALAELGKREEAIDAYGKALLMESQDRDASYNLELLLREEKQKQGGAGNQQENKDQNQKDQKQQQQQQQQQNADQQKKDSQDKQDKSQQQKQQAQDQKQQKPEEKKPQEPDKNQQNQAQQGQEKKDKPQEQKQQEHAQGRPVDRTQAQRLLDALRASEKNLQVWRFGQRQTKTARPRNVEKDW